MQLNSPRGSRSSGQLVENRTNKLPKLTPPLQEEIFASRKQSMDYFTVDGVILRTGYSNKRDWYLLPIRELLDNAIDFLWKNYKGDNASIIVNIYKDDKLFRVKLRNSNQNNIPVFSDLKPIFDYEMRYGSKQDVRVISRGQLGDALKQILSLGYVLVHSDDDGTGFRNQQWEHPLIIRSNRKERCVYLSVDKTQQTADVRIVDSAEKVLANTDTEIELELPVIDEVHSALTRDYIEEFCKKYSLFTTDISFKFRIVDDSTYRDMAIEDDDGDIDLSTQLVTILSTTPKKGIVNIDVAALHPISKEWRNTESIHSCKPDEFVSRIVNVHDKSTSVWKVLTKFKEGTQIKQTSENSISIDELLNRPNKDQNIESLYHELKNTLPPSEKLSLPYTTNPKKRRDVLVSRLAKIYDIDEKKEASYKLIPGYYDDTGLKKVYRRDNDCDSYYTHRKGKGLVSYPFYIEILAAPLKDPIEKNTLVIGAVNYSVSPITNNFNGDYTPLSRSENINELLIDQGFNKWNTKTTRLPCIILCNLITPRRDPHGYDKSSLDIQPFAEKIIQAVVKVASGIQTYRAAGYRFQGLQVSIMHDITIRRGRSR